MAHRDISLRCGVWSLSGHSGLGQAERPADLWVHGLIAECANVLWKKVQSGELLKAEALLAARLLQGAEIELLPTRPLFEAATRLSIEIDHAAYDCLYLALAVEKRCQFVTADERLLRKLHQGRQQTLRGRAISLFEAEKL